jgi:magnesium transporter
MEPEEASEVRALLRYEEESAGRLMSTDIAALRRQWTAAEALDYLRSLEEAETLHYLYVVDRRHHLIGVVPIRSLILARPDATVASIMVPDVVSVQVTADQEEMAEFISRYDFVAIPVVDAQNHLLGVITVDDALDVLAEEATEDIQRLGGSEPLANPYFAVSIWQVVAKRVVWLLPLFAASILTDTVVSVYGGLLQTFVILTLFIPVVSATGGNAGSQTVATIIRAIAVGDVRLADLGRAWVRELSIGIILGIILGAAGLIRALLFGADFTVAIVLGLTLPLVIVVANSLATLFPIVAERLNLDPTVVSAPLITTLVDATGLFIYFTLASLLLQ